MGIRLDKYLSNAGYGSRKDIKILIKRKNVLCEGKIITDPGFKVDDNTKIHINDDLVSVKLTSHLMMNKPCGYLSSNANELEYPSIMELLEFPHPNYNIAGRLDVDTTGLLILSTDGGLIHRIISPKKDVQKLYVAQVLRFSRDKINLFHEGIKIDDGFTTKPVTYFEITEEDDEYMYIKIGITEGKFHQVKKMFNAVGSAVIKLHRHSIGSLILDDNLEPGEYRELSMEELDMLFINP